MTRINFSSRDWVEDRDGVCHAVFLREPPDWSCLCRRYVRSPAPVLRRLIEQRRVPLCPRCCELLRERRGPEDFEPGESEPRCVRLGHGIEPFLFARSRRREEF